MMNEPKVMYSYPYPAQGLYGGPPVVAPPLYTAAPPPRRDPGFLEAWYVYTNIHICMFLIIYMHASVYVVIGVLINII